MILPASYQSGFAPRDGRPLYPSLWRGCVFAAAPCLGPTGLTLRDWSGYGNHGTLTNMDAGSDWVRSGGKYALDFDGTNDYVNVGATKAMTGILDVTVSLWIYPRSSGTDWMVTRYFNTTLSNGWALYGAYTTGFAFDGRESAATYLSSGASGAYSLSSRWYHVVGRKQVNEWSIWVDGVRKNAANVGTGTTTFADNDLRIGGALINGISYYGNAIHDDARIYNRALSPQEIRLLASRRGIAYEMAPRRRYSGQVAGFNAYWAQRRRLIIGSGVN